MEFKVGNPRARDDRRVCSSCGTRCASRKRCRRCGCATKARMEITWYENGERRRELTNCWKQRDAWSLLRRKEEDYWRRQTLGVRRRVGGTFESAVRAFTEAKADKSDNYAKQIATALSALEEGFGPRASVQSITREDIEDFKADGLAHLSSATTRSYLIVVRQFFRWLLRSGWTRNDPTEGVRLPTANARTDHLRPDEVLPLLQAFRSHAPDVAPIATALVLGGWRKGEIVNLRWQDVDLDQRWAYVLPFEGNDLADRWDPKTEASRRAVPLHPLVVEALQRTPKIRRLDGSLSPWVFPVADKRKRRRYADSKGRPQPILGDRRSPGTTFFGKKLQYVIEKTEIDRTITVHGMRRTFAVLLQEAGAPDSVIRAALGHSRRGVTEINYLPRRDPLVQRWVDSIRLTNVVPRIKQGQVLPHRSKPEDGHSRSSGPARHG